MNLTTTYSVLTKAGADDKLAMKLVKKILKQYGARKVKEMSYGDPLTKSIMTQPRKLAKEYGYVEYGFRKLYDEEKDLSEQELENVIYDEIAIPEWHSPYDCTGRPFTMWVDIHKNPCGLISYIHHVGYDV